VSARPAFEAKAGGAATAPRVHVLQPGDVACAQAGERLETLLGSCIAIILTDPRRTLAAMCHFVHVNGGRAQRPGDTTFGEAAMSQMYRLLEQQGISPRLCVAFVYGGGNMFPALVTQPHVGQANAQWALRTLANEGIAVIGQQTCGTVYRRVAWSVGQDEPTVCAVPV